MRAKRNLGRDLLLALLVITATGAGCTKKNKATGAGPAASEKKSQDELPKPMSCAEQAKRLGAALAKLNDPPRVEISPRPSALVPLDRARFVARHLPLLQLRGQNLSLDGRELQSGTKLDQLSQIVVDQLRRRLGASGSTRDVLLALAPSTPWTSIVELVSGLRQAKVRRVGLLVAVKDPQRRRPKSSQDALLDTLGRALKQNSDPGSTPVDTSALLHKVKAFRKASIARCPPLGPALVAAGPVAPAQKARVAGRAIAKALTTCGCKGDLLALHAHLYTMFHQAPVGVVWFEPTDAPPISRPAIETWRQTVASWLSKTPRALIKGKLELMVAP
jgi:hypothetical protein